MHFCDAARMLVIIITIIIIMPLSSLDLCDTELGMGFCQSQAAISRLARPQRGRAGVRSMHAGEHDSVAEACFFFFKTSLKLGHESWSQGNRAFVVGRLALHYRCETAFKAPRYSGVLPLALSVGGGQVTYKL